MEIKELSLEEKVGQLFIVGIQKKIEEMNKLINCRKIGGVILYKNNYNNYSEMIDLVNNLKNNNKQNKIPLFISIDQEGGRVNRMPNEILNVPSATKLSKTENLDIVGESRKNNWKNA